ncbi:MAG TPA: ferrochelatase [Actinomycetaceae bacterium]|nr:ferrochelatase [Actinomycetaceae bacterium]
MRAALLINLGSPASPNTRDVREYLDEFLMDPHVMGLPYPLRALLVRGIICNTRPARSAHAYRSIWRPEGSPLILLSEELHGAVAGLTDVPVRMAMRYGQPSIGSVIEELVDDGVRELFVVPLYPQYAASTRQTVMDEVRRVVRELPEGHEVTIVERLPWFDDPEYLDLLAGSIGRQLDGLEFDRLLLSFHGVPERHIRKADPSGGHRAWRGGPGTEQCCSHDDPGFNTCYRSQCLVTAHEVAEPVVSTGRRTGSSSVSSMRNPLDLS